LVAQVDSIATPIRFGCFAMKTRVGSRVSEKIVQSSFTEDDLLSLNGNNFLRTLFFTGVDPS
jgi:hypothetical protein